MSTVVVDDLVQRYRVFMRDFPLDQRRSEINEPLLREVLAFIEMHQDQWDQGQWWRHGNCNTIGCFAGWTVVLGHPNWGLDRAWEFDSNDIDVPEQATRLLGLTRGQAERLFYYTSVYAKDPIDGVYRTRHPTFADFCRRVEEITGIVFKPASYMPEGLDAA